MLQQQLRTTDRPISGHATAASAARLSNLLDKEIARYQQPGRPGWRSAAPWFPAELERRFDEDTREVRVRNLRFAMILGAVFYLATAATDPVFVPDLGWEGFWLRTLVLPFMVFDVAVGTRLGAPIREGSCALTAGIVVTLLTAIPALSADPFAPFGFATAMFAIAYANTTVVLRFRMASAFTAYCIPVVVGAAVLREGAGNALGWAIGLQVVLTALFSLLANYRIEWSARLSYLLGSREAMRLQALAADRETFKVLSSTDELTQLANRGTFNRKCERAFSDPANHDVPATLLMIDVDHFKRYNDYYGHVAGDECLRVVAQRISQTVRNETDLVARYGGEEFVVLLRDIAPVQAGKLAARVCEAVSSLGLAHENRGDGLVHVTISIGIATTKIRAGSSLEGLLRAADRGLYTAKRRGRNRVEPALVSAA